MSDSTPRVTPSGRLARFAGLAIFVALLVSSTVCRTATAAEPEAGIINAVTEDPADPTVLYAATNAGLFRSTDDGDSWQELTIPGAGDNISAIGVSPASSQHLLAGSALGLFESRDGGVVWTKIRNPKAGVTVIAFSPGNGQTIAVGTQAKGLYVSIDGGVRYKPRSSHLPRPVGRGSKTSITGAAIDPTNSTIGWAGTQVNGIYRLDYKRFVPPENGTAILLESPAPRIHVVVDPQSVNTVYGLIPTQVNSARVVNRLYRSQDGGHTWPEVTPIAQDSELTALYLRPGNSTTLYGRDRTILLSFDIGALPWVPAPLPDPLDGRGGSPRGGGPTVFDRGNVTVIIDDGSIMRASRNDNGIQCDAQHANDDVDWTALGTAFFGPPSARRVVPRHEILTVFPSHAWIGRIDPECNVPIVNTSGGAGAYSKGVRNTVVGIGLSRFDNGTDTTAFPPPLTRLVNMGDKLDEFRACNSLSALYGLAHEVGHTWMSYARYKAPNATISGLNDGSGHWSFGVNTGGSPDGGFEWRDDGGGQFTGVGFGYKYGRMDQYLMGLRPSTDIQDLFFVRTPQPEDVIRVGLGVGRLGGISGGGSSPACSPFDPSQMTLVENSTMEQIRIDQILSVEGNRKGPSAQLLRQAFVLLLPPGSLVNETELALLEQRRLEWSAYYHRATDGLGRVETCLREPCGSCGDGVRGEGEQCDGQDLANTTCSSFSLGGTLGCGLDCRFDLSQCTATCGNGIREGSEPCDGQDLGGVTCQNSGFSGGQVACAPTCTFNLGGCTSGSGRVQGTTTKDDGSPFGAPIIRLEGFGPLTSNPFSVPNLPPGDHRVSSNVPAGFDVTFSVCVNCTNHPANSFQSGSSTIVKVPPGGFVDVQFRYTPTRGSIQGIKIGSNNQSFSGGIVTVDGTAGTSANPFNYTSVTAGAHVVAVTVPAGFSVSRAVCVNCTNTVGSTFTAGNSVSVSVPAGGFVDVWWKFTPTASPGVIQGIKIDANNQSFNSPSVQLDGGSATTANPYTYNNVTAGAHTVSTSVPSGFTASYATCVNCTNTASSTFTAGSSVSVSVPAGGFVDVWWKFTPTNPGVVQGIKIDANNQSFNSPTVRIDGVMPTTANPYAFNNLASGAHTISTTVPSGFTAKYAVCVNCTNTQSSTFTNGSSVSVSVPAGGFVDVWWRFTPTNPGVVQGIKIDSANHAFNSPTVRIDGVMATTANPYTYSNLAPGSHTVSTTVPSGFSASYAVCVNCTNTTSSTFTAGSSVSVSVPAGGFVDVWWKYTP